MDSICCFRDSITQCLITFSTKFCPTPFVEAFMKLKESIQLVAGTRMSALQWISNISDVLSQSDKEKLLPFFNECANFKDAKVRETASTIRAKLSLPADEQQEATTTKMQTKVIPQSPQKLSKQKKVPKGIQKKQVEQIKEEKVIECPRFSQATVAKKTKRLPQLSKMGIQLISNKQLIQSLIFLLHFHRDSSPTNSLIKQRLLKTWFNSSKETRTLSTCAPTFSHVGLFLSF